MINRTVYNNNIHCSCLLWEGVAWQLAFQFERALSHLGRGRTVIQLSPSGNAAANAAGKAVGSASGRARRMSRMMPCERAYESLLYYRSGNMKDWLIC
jgi:hypothetical protein